MAGKDGSADEGMAGNLGRASQPGGEDRGRTQEQTASLPGSSALRAGSFNACREWIMRCPRLGGEVPFSYCEQEAGDLPCRQVVRCWAACFPVEAYLCGTLTSEAWERFSSEVPKDRMSALLDIALAAKEQRKK